MSPARVVSVSSDDEHRFTKPRRDAITLVITGAYSMLGIIAGQIS